MPRKPGTPKTGGKLPSRRCATCGKLRIVDGWQHTHSARYCSDSCEEAGRNDSRRITLPCGNCGRLLSVPVSKVAEGQVQTYCNRAGYLSARHGKQMPGACESGELARGYRLVAS